VVAATEATASAASALTISQEAHVSESLTVSLRGTAQHHAKEVKKMAAKKKAAKKPAAKKKAAKKK
jgi:hypothetical protein